VPTSTTTVSIFVVSRWLLILPSTWSLWADFIHQTLQPKTLHPIRRLPPTANCLSPSLTHSESHVPQTHKGGFSEKFRSVRPSLSGCGPEAGYHSPLYSDECTVSHVLLSIYFFDVNGAERHLDYRNFFGACHVSLPISSTGDFHGPPHGAAGYVLFAFPPLICNVYQVRGHHGRSPDILTARRPMESIHARHQAYFLHPTYTFQYLTRSCFIHTSHVRSRLRHRRLRV
jgi:hypothetical protein